MLLSIIITSYNYADFISQSIDSALALDWPHVEVIVVDDGSTDSSREIIAGYGDRITPIFQENGGHYRACNAGFAKSKGDVVMFLDADDLLDPSLPRALFEVFGPGVSKVQFQMKIIDAEGRPTGGLLPQYQRVPTPSDIRRWASTAAAYPTPPGSGNAYARSFLERIFPLSGGDTFADSYCLPAAPYFGDVVTVPQPLVSYRVHGKNDGAMSELEAARFAKEVARAEVRFRYGQASAREQGFDVPDRVFYNSMSVLPYRMASYRLAPEQHPLMGDSRSKILVDCARATFIPQGMDPKGRVALLLWASLVAVSPDLLTKRLVLWRFSSVARPAWLTGTLRSLRILK